jgi:hypothetical protein
MASPWPVKRCEASPRCDLDALERARAGKTAKVGAHAGGKNRERVGAGKKEIAHGRRGEHAGKKESTRPANPALARRVRPCLRTPCPPCSRAGSTPTLALALRPLLSCRCHPSSPPRKDATLRLIALKTMVPTVVDDLKSALHPDV